MASAGRAGIAKLVIQNLPQALGEEEQIVCGKKNKLCVCMCARVHTREHAHAHVSVCVSVHVSLCVWSWKDK